MPSIALAEHSNSQARRTWEAKAVGSQRSTAYKGTQQYFEHLRSYRYGYETPFIPTVFEFSKLAGKSVLEIGVGNGIDAVEMARSGARYTGLDITQNHLQLTQQNFSINLPEAEPTLIHGDLLDVDLSQSFDRIYSFGVLHHIAHEDQYLQKLRSLLKDDGKLLIAVYSKWSVFNAYMSLRWLTNWTTWVGKLRLDDWRSHIAEGSPIGEPVTIKIRSRREVERVLVKAGFQVSRYVNRGFVQNYLPFLGRYLQPNGWVLNCLGSLLGWYHIFQCTKSPNSLMTPDTMMI